MNDQFGRRDFLKLLASGVAAGGALPLSACISPRLRGAGGDPHRTVQAYIQSNSFSRPAETFPTRIVDDLPGFSAIAGTPRFSSFGGRLDEPTKGTGYFRVGKSGDRWWLYDPQGYEFLDIAVNSVSPKTQFGSAEAFAAKFGSEAAWAEKTAELLRSLGFNGTGSWSADALLAGVSAAVRPAYTPNSNFMSSYGRKRGGTFQEPGHTGYPNGTIFVFDPEFETFCDEHARRLSATANDPWLLGHFTDNEMPLGPKILDGYLGLSENDPGHVAAREWLDARGVEPAGITDELREEFRGFVADRYFSIVTRAIRRYDPNHMILGSRFYGSEKDSEAVFRAVGRHVDVVAVNVYSEWTPNFERFARWTAWSGRPVLATEWYAKGEDSGMENTSGAGWTVPTQRERGWFYQNFTLGLLEMGTCVGWHWFKYLDNDPLDTTVDPSNSNSNKGMLTAQYEPYRPLTEAMRELNFNAYRLADYFDARRAG
jgi:hypothetical protein